MKTKLKTIATTLSVLVVSLSAAIAQGVGDDVVLFDGEVEGFKNCNILAKENGELDVNDDLTVLASTEGAGQAGTVKLNNLGTLPARLTLSNLKLFKLTDSEGAIGARQLTSGDAATDVSSTATLTATISGQEALNIRPRYTEDRALPVEFSASKADMFDPGKYQGQVTVTCE